MSGTSGTHDKIEGTFHENKGAVVEAVGHAVGNEKVEKDGKQEKIEGQIQRKVGEVKTVFGM
jgi:uncharacterized protein YjbJ (UPF0337 family)